MPKEKVVRRARQARREGKAPSTQASEFVREKMHELGRSKGPKSRKQAIAVGLDEARRAGVPLPPSPEARSEAQGGSQQAARTGAQSKTSRSPKRARPARTGQKRTAQKRKSTRGATNPKRSTARKSAAKARARSPAAPEKRGAAKRTSSASPARSGRARTASRKKPQNAPKRTRARIEG